MCGVPTEVVQEVCLLHVTLIALALAGEPPQGDWEAGAGFDGMAASVRADVEDHVSGVNMFKRPFARTALVRATAPCAHVGIHNAANGLTITCDDRKVAVAPPSGDQVSYTGNDGKTLGLVHEIEADGAVVQTFISRRGERVNRFVPVGGGGLRMEVTITSGLLSDPLRYFVVYQP
jgi:hypothetical protein